MSRVVATLLVVLLAAACEGPQRVLDVRGPGAGRIATLWWVAFGLGTVIFAGVLALLVVSLRRRRERPVDGTLHPDRWPVWGGIVLPVVVIMVVLTLTARTLAAHRRDLPEPGTLTVHVIGRQWWWEVEYRGSDLSRHAVTANEIHIPTGRPVRIELSSRDVNHSFWVPQLQGKIDLIPGRKNVTWIQADTPGVFRGQCAEFCGLQHAHMAFEVVARPPAEFDRWLAHQQSPAAVPETGMARRGAEHFQSAGCALCHQVRGTAAFARVGPDLTHVASRRTLAAATVPNRTGYLAGWVIDPQSLKPGNHMPGLALSGTELRELLAYLQSLE